jgi:hypothetical protein
MRPEQIDPHRAIELGRAQNVDAVLIGTIIEAAAEESTSSAYALSILRQSCGLDIHSAKASVMFQAVVYVVATGVRVGNMRVPPILVEKI